MSKKYSNPVLAYFASAFEEFGKVTWPTKEQAALLTGIVVVFSAIFVVILASLDLGFNELYQLVTK